MGCHCLLRCVYIYIHTHTYIYTYIYTHIYFLFLFLFYFTKRGAIRLQLLLKRQSLLATPARRAPTHPLASAHAHSSFSMNSYSTSKTQFMTLPLKPSPSRQVCLIPKPSLVLLLFCVSAPLNSSSLNPRSVSKGSVSSSSAPARCRETALHRVG